MIVAGVIGKLANRFELVFLLLWHALLQHEFENVWNQRKLDVPPTSGSILRWLSCRERREYFDWYCSCEEKCTCLPA